jgi:UDP-GlcNAc:undecaprenyl-phosphate GlcNAc-1-phosphate transferase
LRLATYGSYILIYLSTLLIATFITLMMVPVLMRVSVHLNAVDWPGERKVHSIPVPRCGGLAMVLGGAVPILLWAEPSRFTQGYLLGIFILLVFGSLDDFKGMGYRTKFIGQFAAALVIVLYGGVAIKSLGGLLPDGMALSHWVSILLSVIAIVGVTNAINLADGLDGLAGGISFLGFCLIGYLASQAGNTVITLMAIALCGAIFGFLRFNTYPASLFMGDTGSQLLGFSAIAFSIVLTQEEKVLSPLLPLLILGFPVLDTLTVMADRIAKGKSPFAADKNHFHHRLMKFGFSHKEAVFIIYFLQTLLILAAYAFRYSSEWVLLAGYLVFAMAVVASFHFLDRHGWKYPRIHFLDTVLKGPMRAWAEGGTIIRISFRLLAFSLVALLLFNTFFSASPPRYVSLLSGGLAALLIAVRFLNSGWLRFVLPFSVYLLIPFLLYFGQVEKAGWISGQIDKMQNFAYIGLTLLIFLVMHFTRRKKGFRTTPLDFLVLFAMAVIIPRLPFEDLSPQQVGILSAKILVLFFGVEVLLGELRGKYDRFGLAVLLVLTVVTVRGIIA